MKEDILIITNYYPPETGAASNRISQLAEGLAEKGAKVGILTPLPNYPTGKIFDNFKGKIRNPESVNNVSIYRLWIYPSNSKNKILRLFAMLSYSFSLMFFIVKNRIPKTVIIQSPPLLVAFTSILFLRSKKRKLVLNVSDLWPLAGLELNVLKKNYAYKILEKIECFNYKNADLILGQSNEILSHVKSLFPEKDTFLYRNYPKVKVDSTFQSNKENPKIRIVYAGLLGVAQGIYKLIESIELNGFEFHIYGNGVDKIHIENYIANNPEKQIIYHGEIARDTLNKVLPSYDIALIPLVNRIYGSVPSKIFELAYLGLPVLYFGGGEGEKIITNNHLGWVVEAGNYAALNEQLQKLKKSSITNEKRVLIQKKALEEFNLDKQIDDLSNKLFPHP